MGAVGCTDNQQLLDPRAVPGREGQRDHAAIGGADDRAQARDLQVIEQPAQRLGLIEARETRKRAVRYRSARGTAAAQKIDAEHAYARAVECPTGTRDLGPPTLPWGLEIEHAPVRRDAPERDHHRRRACAVQAPADPRVLDRATVQQR
jgi:hypothetical protein